MKKYLTFAKYCFKQQVSSIISYVTPIFSYIVHILILNQLFEFIFQDKIIDGFSHIDLVWYVITAEVFLYSFHNGYRIISRDITTGNIAYNLSKPYNFMLRIIAEQLSTCIKTGIILIIGLVIGLILAGPITITWYNFLLFVIVFVLSLVLQLLIHLIVGMSSLWIGQDVNSIWWIVSKFMLILVFTPLDLFPKVVQTIFKLLPTTHAIYTPCQLLVHFSYDNFFESLIYVICSLIVLTGVCIILYKKGVKKINVNGI